MIDTERLRLEPLSRAHLEPWTRFMLDGDARAGLHTPDPAESADAAAAGLDRFVEVAEMYAIVDRETGEVAGFSGFVPRELEWGEELELGWMLLPAARGRGYATEAARTLLATRPSQRIISLIREDNLASQAVATRIGAARERVFEYWGYQTGVWVSHGGAGERSIQR
jgi:RimJ/RimL family protein N-acetyltransferase